MKIAGLVGWHNSGKTTLLVALVQELASRGHRVSTIKHAHHAFDVDTPGKDSWRHRDAGATEVMVGSEKRWALMHELRDAAEPSLTELLAHMTPVDLVIVEGFKNEDHDKIEVYRESLDEPLLANIVPNVVAVVSDKEVRNLPPGVSHLDLNDTSAVADYIEQRWSLADPSPHTAMEDA